MSVTWDDGTPPEPVHIGPAGWLRIALRGLSIVAVIGVGLLCLLSLYGAERAVGIRDRRWSAWVTVIVCRIALRLIGLSVHRIGAPMTGRGAMVANHTSWLDIFVLNAGAPLVFVSKSEVAGWPGIGWLARATGTLFIQRTRTAAKAHTQALAARLHQGARPLFFPEGTSTDGQQVLPFKTPLFEAFLNPELPQDLQVQPVSVRYHAPQGHDARVYGWWGDMGFGPHLLSTLALARQGRVQVVYHPPLDVRAPGSRKALAAQAEQAVRQGHAASA
ncbi:MAG: lysophospholipid acyltransferase family protein [Pseudomonadota bacterium]